MQTFKVGPIAPVIKKIGSHKYPSRLRQLLLRRYFNHPIGNGDLANFPGLIGPLHADIQCCAGR